jgi:hypothetical protein
MPPAKGTINILIELYHPIEDKVIAEKNETNIPHSIDNELNINKTIMGIPRPTITNILSGNSLSKPSNCGPDQE